MLIDEKQRKMGWGNGRPVRRLLIPIAILVVGFCAICIDVLIESRRGIWERAGDASASLVAAIESDVARNIETLDLSLQAVVDNLKHPDIDRVSPELRQLILFDRSATAHDLGTIMVVDANGDLRLDSRTTDINRQNLADREYFKIHQQRSDVGLFISKPMVSRVTGQWFIGLSRRLANLDGSFAGVVVASLRLSYFDRLFERVSLGNKSNITLGSADGTIIMRWPYGASFIGREIAHADIYKHLSVARTGRFETVSATDGENRLVAYSQIANFPLVIGIGQSTSVIYEHWLRYALVISAIMVALCGLALFLALYLERELKRRRQAEAELTTLAITDGLTGLYNHRHFNETLKREWQRAARDQQPVSLMMIDADFFKIYNDKNGHPSGDELLQAIGAAIADSVNRGSDFGARYGGDEFALLLVGTPAEGASRIAEKIRIKLLSICQQRTIEPAGLSIGIASTVPDDSHLFGNLIRTADEALYSAKNLGRNRTEVRATSAKIANRLSRVA